MNNFMDGIKKELDKTMTFTENGALAYETSGKALTDFLFTTTALRGAEPDVIDKKITSVYFEDPMIANRFMFWMRDCRGGNGERKVFRAYLAWLADNKPKVCKAIIPLVSEYGRWDDLWCLLDTPMKDEVIALVKTQIASDIENCDNNKGISLLSKWLPSEVTSSKETRRLAKIIREGLDLTPRQYRKTLSKLRAYLDVVEVKTSANRWDEIKYETVPSQANIKYSDAFMRHDENRRTNYLEALSNGKTKINANVLQPHEIVKKYGKYYRINSYDEALEQLWKALPVKSLDNCLVVRDGSGSMESGYKSNVTPLEVATALAIYMADHNHGIWKDKFITFSANPKFIDLSCCENLHDKLIKTYNEDECSNTNIEKTMMLILQTAINNHCSQEDMPQNIVIVSDMGFDSATLQYERSDGDWRCRFKHIDNSLFDNISMAYKEAGYKLPRIVFWNVAGEIKNGIPMQQNELGVVLMSGFSIQLLDMVMSGELDPYKAILEVINSSRYDAVEEAVKGIV